MSQIRRQSIISSLMVYIGFALGFFNTYLYTRQGGFTQEEYGLVGIFIAIATLMYSLANLGMPAYIAKFYPYYNDNLAVKENDLITWALLVSLLGFLLVMAGGFYFKDTIVYKFGQNSPLLIEHYYWLFPFGLGLSLYSILEAYAWQLKKAVLTNYLREIQFRLCTTFLILLSFAGIIGSFTRFIQFYSFTYVVVALLLLAHLIYHGRLHLTFRISRVTKKFYKKILTLISFVFGGTLVYGISLIFDSIVIASVLGLKNVAIFSLGQYMASLIQAPQRGIIASSIGPLSQAWKDKDLQKINTIYRQSSINQLIFSVGIFALVWLNFTDAISTFKLQAAYLDAKWVFFFIGLYRIVDMGTGVNSQIIGTSTLWRFEFFTGIVLLLLTLPLTYTLTKSSLHIVGPAVASLISFSIYNAVRCVFLYKKFGLLPFTNKTIYTIVLGLVAYGICWLLLHNMHGFFAMVVRSLLFLLLFIWGTVYLQLSADVLPVWKTLLKKLGIKQQIS
jgi:O-antigen/teichoic acid export membrane protein